MIRPCRASGLTNQAWCEQHDISLKSYYYWIAKIRKLALEELPRKNYVCRPIMEQAVLALDTTPRFTEISFRDRQIPSATPAAVLRIGSVTVELFEDTPCGLLKGLNPEQRGAVRKWAPQKPGEPQNSFSLFGIVYSMKMRQ